MVRARLLRKEACTKVPIKVEKPGVKIGFEGSGELKHIQELRVSSVTRAV
jgi:hypothetical protein